jgi:ABC-type branched-subunit amino acid transport system substrate-binding protein
MDRRAFLFSAAASLLPSGQHHPAAEARAVLLLPLTGERAPLGRMLRGVALAAAESVNRALPRGARRVALQVEDWQSDPRRFDALVRRHGVGEGRPAALMGPCPHELRRDVGTFLEAVDGALWDPQGYEGGECSPALLHFGPTPHQSLTQALPFLAREVGNRFLLVAGEGAYGSGLARVGKWALGRMGAELVGKAEPGMRVAWLRKLKRERVDVVLCTLEGAELAGFLAAYGELRLDPASQPILAPAMTELEARAAGSLAAGHVSCQPYYAAWRTLGNDRFLAALRRYLEPGTVPTAQGEALWGLIHLFGYAVANLGSLTLHPVLVREAARGRELLLPQGRVVVETETLHPRLWPKLAIVNSDGSFKVIARSQRAVPPLPFWGLDSGACPARDVAVED